MDLQEMGLRAVKAKYDLQKATEEEKNRALILVADRLLEEENKILAANQQDIEAGERNGVHPGMLDRLRLNKNRLQGMAEGLRQIATLPDPIGEVLESFERPNGLAIQKLRVPLGVIGIIYESRPNVTADAFGLCFKAGNVVILKGGSDAICSNIAISEVIRTAVVDCGINSDAIQMITDTSRAVTAEFIKMNQYVDVLIPRGGSGLIQAVLSGSSIPVIETGTGNCHIYIDAEADLEMSIPIVVNAKTQRIGVCNACESLVIHKDIKEAFLLRLGQALKEYHVEIRGDEDVCRIWPEAVPVTEEDYGTEYLDYILSIKIVSNLEEAISHINKYNTKHSDAILTLNAEHGERFLREVDAACVYVNASTRFTDGFEFGLGAEIGISTQMLHARGPMGLKELTTYKYTIHGNGQTRA